MSELVELTDEQWLEIEGTDPLEWDAPLARLGAVCSDATLARLGAVCSDATLARLKATLEMVPVIDKPYTAILASIEQPGCSIEMGNWHTCETTHCVGGWTVHKAGKAGYALEKRLGDTAAAAACILRKSRPDAPLPNFYASNKAALAFIRARAKEEN